MNTEQLAEAVKKIAGLDSERTQGEWSTDTCLRCQVSNVLAGGKPVIHAHYIYGDDYEAAASIADADFIAAAPQMAATVAQLWKERTQMQVVIEKAWELAHENLGKRKLDGFPPAGYWWIKECENIIILAAPFVGGK